MRIRRFCIVIAVISLYYLWGRPEPVVLDWDTVCIGGVFAGQSYDVARHNLDLAGYNIVSSDEDIVLSARDAGVNPDYLRFSRREGRSGFFLDRMSGSAVKIGNTTISEGDSRDLVFELFPGARSYKDSCGTQCDSYAADGMFLEFRTNGSKVCYLRFLRFAATERPIARESSLKS